jgi:hypothetical protein
MKELLKRKKRPQKLRGKEGANLRCLHRIINIKEVKGMNEKQFYEAVNLLATETKILQANANKLAKYAMRNKPKKIQSLFSKIEYDTSYLRALYEKIQAWAYWNKDKVSQKDWELFTKEFEGFFSKLEIIITNIRKRDGGDDRWQQLKILSLFKINLPQY